MSDENVVKCILCAALFWFHCTQQSMGYREVYPYTCEVKYSNGKWSQPRIVAKNESSVKLNSLVLSYGNSIIEGMKAYRGEDGKIRTYRPNYKYGRLSYSARRVTLPVVPKDSFYKCLKMFIRKVKRYLPPTHTNGSIYMRPNLFETTDVLKDKTGSKSATFHVYGSKVTRPIFGGEAPTICLRIETIRSKSENGSLAYIKSGANYAATYFSDKMSLQKGCQNTLWLYKGHICELSIGNIWMVLYKDGEKLLVTPPAEFILAPGSIRNAIFTLAKEKGYRIAEALISINSIKEMVAKQELLEIFTSGHYVDITPLTNLFYNNEEIEIPTLDQKDPVYIKMWEEMYSIYFARKSDVNNWMYLLE